MIDKTTRSVEYAPGQIGERRSERRRRVFRGGRLIFNAGFSTFDCIVREQSGQGARLAFGEPSGVPAHFDLVISGEQAVHSAHVRWRSASEFGVTLV